MTKSDVLAALACRPVPFEAGGVRLHLAPLGLAERLSFGAWLSAHPEAPQADGWAVAFALSVCDAGGDRLFPADPAQALAEMKAANPNAAVVEAVAARVADLNGLGPGKVPGPGGTN